MGALVPARKDQLPARSVKLVNTRALPIHLRRVFHVVPGLMPVICRALHVTYVHRIPIMQLPSDGVAALTVIPLHVGLARI